jgi:hypothetical protein
MSLLDKKQDIFDKIGAFTSMQKSIAEQGKQLKSRVQNTFSSINNKDDVIAFLLDALKTIAGSEAIKQQVGELLTTFLDGAEDDAKEFLKKQLIQYDSGKSIDTTQFSSGITVQAKSIDYAMQLPIPPDSETGNLLYGVQNSYNRSAHDAIANPGTDVAYNNLYINYDINLDSFTFKPKIAVSPVPTVGEWLGSYIDDAVIIDKKEFVSKVMDSIYGTISKKLNKSVEQTYEELQVQKLIEQLMEGNDSFVINQSDFDELLEKAKQLVDGVVYYDLGCGLMAAEFPFSGMTDLISTISGSTDSYVVANAIEGTINESTKDNQEATAENRQTIRDGFFSRLIKLFTVKLIEAITTAPQIRTLLAITSAIKNDGVAVIGKITEDMKNYKIFIQCMIQDLIRMISEFIFTLAIGYLIVLLKPIIKKIYEEKIKQYVEIVQSLTIKI